MPSTVRTAGRAFAFWLLLSLGACTPLIAAYNVEAYSRATTLKAETMAMIAVSGEPYAEHRAEARALQTRLNAGYEFANGLPQNEISARMWRMIADHDGHLAGGFLRLWEEHNTTGSAYRTAKTRQIEQAFDYLICLEANKRAAQRCHEPATPNPSDAAETPGSR